MATETIGYVVMDAVAKRAWLAQVELQLACRELESLMIAGYDFGGDAETVEYLVADAAALAKRMRSAALRLDRCVAD